MKLVRKFCEKSLFSRFCCITALIGKAAWDGCRINTLLPYGLNWSSSSQALLCFTLKDANSSLCLPALASFSWHFFIYPCSGRAWFALTIDESTPWTCNSTWTGGWFCTLTKDTGPCWLCFTPKLFWFISDDSHCVALRYQWQSSSTLGLLFPPRVAATPLSGESCLGQSLV